jgi:hypothetical protein
MRVHHGQSAKAEFEQSSHHGAAIWDLEESRHSEAEKKVRGRLESKSWLREDHLG